MPAEVTEEALLRALAQVALGNGKAAYRLRAIELLGKYKGMFREQQDKGPSLVELIAAAHKGMEVKP